jgi:hypothetical protein
LTAKVYGGIHTLTSFGFEPVTSKEETHATGSRVYCSDQKRHTGSKLAATTELLKRVKYNQQFGCVSIKSSFKLNKLK